MIRILVKKEDYSTLKKFNVYNLIIVNKILLFNKNKRVNKETKLLLIAI